MVCIFLTGHKLISVKDDKHIYCLLILWAVLESCNKLFGFEKSLLIGLTLILMLQVGMCFSSLSRC